MSARGFGSVIWAGAVAGAALGFYLVSLRVASERSALEDVETEIAMTQRDIRLLQTEIGTRGRLAQLERWNVRFIRLSAPTADQFVDGGFQLATLVKPIPKPAIEAPVILAAAPVQQSVAEPKLTDDTDEAHPQVSRPVSEMIHVASYTVPQQPAVKIQAPPKPAIKPAVTTSRATKPAPATKPVKTATADPLAPLPTGKAKAKGSAPKAAAPGISPKTKTKDSDKD
jgi:hypothetical protein